MSQATDSWTRMIEGLAPLGARAADRALNAGDSLSRHETWHHLAVGFAQGVLQHLQADAEHPEFMPHLNHVFNLAAPPPDFLYRVAFIDGEGSYRVSGFRGTSRFVDIDMLGGHHSIGGKAFGVGSFTLDSLQRDERGYFSVILSAERPAGYDGDWVQLHPQAMMLLVRFAACDWLGEVDARLAIERLDRQAVRPRQTAERIAARMEGLVGWTERVVVQWLDHVATRRKQGHVNRLPRLQYAAGASGQAFYEGLYDLADDEVLVIETAVPRQCRYWSIMLADDQLCTIDWMYRQSSLNDLQARLDSDGKLRVVVSHVDPGVPNWLDTAGYRSGMIGLRWNQASDLPDPSVTLMPLAQLRSHLPADTPSVTPVERDAMLRARREGAQLRQRW